MTEREAQKLKILRFMQDGNKITDATARALFKCARISARIYDLRHDGVPVLDDWDYELDKNGKVIKKWKKYWIAKAPSASS